jgi:cytosine deaminase
MPRGLTAVAALHEAGATVAAGADNLQDPFNPVGRACPFETAGLMIMAAHLTPQEAWRAVSSAPACVLGVESPAVMVGAPAHLIAVAATTLREAIALGPADRLRLRFGRPIGEIQS